MNNFPKHWQVKKLGEIISKEKYAMKRGPFGSALKKDFFVENGVRVFEQYNPINQDPHWKRYFITQDKFKELEAFKATGGDLLISCSGTLGKILELPKDVEFGIINQALLKIRLDSNQILNSYFIHYFNSNKFQNLILEKTIGTAIKNIASVAELKKFEIPIPSLDEQNLIVKKIESCFEKIDFAISNFKKSKELIEIYKQSVLSHAFNGKLTNSNLNSWQVKKLGEICDLISGRDLEADKYSSSICDYPYLIGASNFNNGEVEITRWTNFPAVIAKKGDLLITCKGSIGEMAICKFGKLHIARQIMAVRAKDKIFNLFLKYLLHFEVDKIKKSAKGIIPGIDRKIILNLEIPLPPLSEQNLIVSQIEKRFKAADSALNLIEQNLKKAEILKQSILSKAFNGRLVKDKNE